MFVFQRADHNFNLMDEESLFVHVLLSSERQLFRSLTNNSPSRNTFFKSMKLDLLIYRHVLRKTLPIPVKWLYCGENSI